MLALTMIIWLRQKQAGRGLMLHGGEEWAGQQLATTTQETGSGYNLKKNHLMRLDKL